MNSKLIVITGPSGVGKTYLAEQLSILYPKLFKPVKLYSTRKPRSNERFTDRIFITDKEFQAKQKNNEFIYHGSFHGNRYGYPRTLLKPSSKHFIVNAWPAFIPKFSSLSNVVIVGLTITQESMPLLQQRMLNRGDTATQIDERIPLIQRDIQDLERFKRTIKQLGKVFIIKDDQTIPGEVIPWLEATVIAPKTLALMLK